MKRGAKKVVTYTDAELAEVAKNYVRSASKATLRYHAAQAVLAELVSERKKGKRALAAKVGSLKYEARLASQAKEFLDKYKHGVVHAPDYPPLYESTSDSKPF